MNQGELIEKMADDLNIPRYEKEDDIYFKERVIYTAIGQWIQASILDHGVSSSDITETCRTPQYISQKCRKILNAYLILYPEVNEWFNFDKNTNPIRLIYKRYLYAGSLVSARDNTYQIAKTRYGKISENLYYVSGLPESTEENIEHYGLGSFVSSVPEGADVQPIEKLFNLLEKTAYRYAKDLVSAVSDKMVREEIEPPGREYYDILGMKGISSSWTNMFNMKWSTTVYRNNKYTDYGLVQNREGKLYTWKFPEYMVKSHEIRRVMFGLRSEGLKSIGGNQNAYSTVESKQYVKISLNSTLPKAEEILLYQIAWPVRSIKDGGEFVTSPKFLPLIRAILNKKLGLSAWKTL